VAHPQPAVSTVTQLVLLLAAGLVAAAGLVVLAAAAVALTCERAWEWLRRG